MQFGRQIEAMEYKNDQLYLLHNQYKDASNLNARIQLHQRFGTNSINWYTWLFDQFTIASGSRILELGCGPGGLWQKNLHRLPADWDFVLSDFSAGMLHEAQHNLCDSGRNFTFQVIDAQAIPFADNSFDTVLANHMLYHVPNRPRAFSEIRRVLRPTGYFYAATNGVEHLQEIIQLKQRAGITIADASISVPFTLENGTQELEPWFAHVKIRRREDEMVITEAEPLIAFILSGKAKDEDAKKLHQLRDLIEQEIAQHDAIRVKESSGIFSAYGEKQAQLEPLSSS